MLMRALILGVCLLLTSVIAGRFKGKLAIQGRSLESRAYRHPAS